MSFKSGRYFEYKEGKGLIEVKCKTCSRVFWLKKYRFLLYKNHFCSEKCRFSNKEFIKNMSFSNSKWWKGGRIEHGGYIYIKVGKGISGADSQGYFKEHRMVMEKVLGRKLKSTEDVHHLNGIKTDNRPENLVVINKANHGRLHNPVGLKKSPETIKNMRAAQKNAPWKIGRVKTPEEKEKRIQTMLKKYGVKSMNLFMKQDHWSKEKRRSHEPSSHHVIEQD